MDGIHHHVDSLSLAELEAQITELAGHLNAANYRWLRLIAEFDRRHGWSDGALHSCAHWLNFKCGLNLGAARERVRVAHALEALPRIAAAMASGRLSYSKARALTRVAEAGTEEYFLSIALHGTAHHVETLVRHYRRAHEAEELSREARQEAGRSASYWFDLDGSLVIKARLPALAGAMLIKALEAAMDEIPTTETAVEIGEEVRLSWQARRADALALMAQKSLQCRARTLNTADRYQVVVHLDAQTLRDRTAGRCEIEQGTTLAVETARRLTCDASLVKMLENSDGEPLDVGRKTRVIPPAIRRAIRARDTGCRFPGCTHQRYLDAHHIQHWADGGPTHLKNLIALCRQHHRLVHEGGVTVRMSPEGIPQFLRPDGTPFDRVISIQEASYDGTELQSTHDRQGIRIDSDTAATLWRGERMDYDLGVHVLLQHAERSQNVSAETSEQIF
jgi:Domain of unknown function (DUF222)/HNH endonuclease